MKSEPVSKAGCKWGWKEATQCRGWYQPECDSHHRTTKKGTNVEKSWPKMDFKARPGKTGWSTTYNAQVRQHDNPDDHTLWYSDTGNVQKMPKALRKTMFFVWESLYADTVKSGGIIVWPNPPSAPELEVDPADGIHGTIRVKYNHKNKPGLKPEPVNITVVGKSEYRGEDTVLFISKMTSGGSQEEDVIFREHGFAEGYHIKYQATAVDTFKQTASSGWVSGHHYNKTPDAPEGWRANTVVPTETKPYTKIHVTHEPADDIEHDNVTYELKYEFYNEDGSVAVPMRT